ncbi:MAG TPA: tetratricopeptide repeat protein [Bryobacteraceae bacterium]
MQTVRADRCLIFSIVLVFGFSAQLVYSQGRPGSSPPPSGNSGNVPSNPSPGTPSRSPGNIPNGNVPNNNGTFNSGTTFPQHPIFLSGRVMFDDGTPPNNEVRIERVCGANPRFEAHTDSKGRFSFQLGNDLVAASDMDPGDASEGALGPSSRQMDSQTNGMGRRSGMNPYWNCELRASYPGYRSDVVELSSRRAMDDPNVGTIVLHRLSNVKGTTISLTSAMAPKHAQKEYEKGVQLAEKEKFEDAEKHLLKATEEYPKYAAAWYTLGRVQQKLNRPDDARKSFQTAAAADSKFVSPYDQLALLAAHDGKWEDAANFSKQVIDLNPVEFPGDFWYNAVANYNLKKMDAAQKSAQELLKLDTKHQFPEAESMLAQIYLEKANYDEAAAHLKAYLALAPNAKNADALKAALAKIEQAKAETKK